MLPRQWWAEGAVSSTARFPSAALGQGDPLDISARPPSSGIFSVTRPVCNAYYSGVCATRRSRHERRSQMAEAHPYPNCQVAVSL
jgi:hypothetical protein